VSEFYILTAIRNAVNRLTSEPAPNNTPAAGSDGKINGGWLPSVIKSGGNSTATGYQIANGADLATLFGKLEGVENTYTGAVGYMTDAALSVADKNVRLSETLVAPSYCTYCTYCASYCSYCTYCTTVRCTQCVDCSYCACCLCG
jgi:hypothetical protein